jgi:glycosyltransferase involved in cell wall biosynthesis
VISAGPASSARTVHFVVPPGIDDPGRPSGGNTYDRRVIAGLSALGWSVPVHAVDGPWPRPDERAEAALAATLTAIDDDALVLIDGLVASAAPSVLRSHASRLQLVVLLHMALEHAAERDALTAARTVITTSEWLRQRVVDLYSLPRVRVAAPGVDPAPLAVGTANGGNVLCVAALAPHKGQDVLLAALAELADRPWRCSLVGSPDIDPGFVARLREQVERAGLDARVSFTGAMTGDALARAYGQADVLVLASQSESYGLVITEALAAGVPVIATAVGGVSEALGETASGRPGLLVEVSALPDALRRWFDDADLRWSLRAGAATRRATLAGWDETARNLESALRELSEPVGEANRV